MPTLRRWKSVARDRLPACLQVPAKYWYSRWRGTLEPEMALLDGLVAPGRRCLDIGGNYGANAYRLARLGAVVEVFEPNPVCLRALDAWAAGRRGVTIHPVAASASAGEGALVVPVDPDGVLHDAAGSLQAQTGEGRRIAVATRAIDQFGFTDVQFVKIDVEGHEAAAIAGARATVAASLPALLVEIEQRHSPQPIAATFAAIAALGYRGWFLRGRQLVPLTTFDPARDQRLDALGSGAGYHNNFLFLAAARLDRGEYRALFARYPVAGAARP